MAVLVPSRARAALTGGALMAFAAPAAFGLPWWSAAIFDLLVAAVALAVALYVPSVGSSVRAGRSRSSSAGLIWPSVIAAILAAHAVAAGFGRPGIAAGTLAGVTLLGLATAAAARTGTATTRAAAARARIASTVSGIGASAVADQAGANAAASGGDAGVASNAHPTAAGHFDAGRRYLGGYGLATGLLAVPAIAWTGAAALSVPSSGQARLALAATALLVGALHLVAGRWAEYAGFAFAAALLAMISAPTWALAVGDSAAIYAGIALLLVALTLPALTSSSAQRPAPAGGSEGTDGPTVSTGSSVPAGPSVPARPSVPAVHSVQSASSPSSTSPGSAVASAGSDRRGSRLSWVAAAAVPLVLVLLVAAGPSLFAVLVRPLGWLSRVWDGRPTGAGLDRFGVAHVAVADVVALALLAAAAALAGWFLSGRRAAAWACAPALAVVVPMAFASAAVSWPAVPAASLLVGLASMLVVALRPPFASGTGGFGAAGAGGSARGAGPGGLGAAGAGGSARGAGLAVAGAAALVVVSFALVAAGLAGALPTHGSTLAALGAILVAGAVAGAAARDLPARVVGWLVAAAAALGVAFTVGRAFELSLRTTAFAVLATAAVTLGLGTILAGWKLPIGSAGRHTRRRVAGAEARAVQAAAHAGAVVALLLTTGSARHAAAVCTLWGLALGVRALRPGEQATVRGTLIVAAAGAELGRWWLLLVAEEVATLEAYTLPAAAVALLAGWLARRSRPGLGSWTAYGPALAAAMLPTLASVLVGDGQPVRRLLLGLGALAVLLAGANGRLRAPVISGGVVLAVVALHEVVLVWDLLPRWIPLAAGGLLLVGLAMTLERRRRDLDRFRAALTRMS